MATRRTIFGRPNYRFLPDDLAVPSDVDSALEFDESDIYYSSCRSNSSGKSVAGARIARSPAGKRAEDRDRAAVLAPSSLPVNIPDWSKILREEYQDSAWKRDSLDNDLDEDEDEEEDDGSGLALPPHEFLARQMAQSAIGSLGGVSRTLKVREMNRVRNAVWARIGFED